MVEILQTFLSGSAWVALLTLTFLEVVLGVDNIVFITLMSSKLPPNEQSKARTIGLLLAMFTRIGLLFAVSALMQLTKPLFTFSNSWISGAVTGQSIIILLGGLFLLYKSVTEIHDKLEGKDENVKKNKKKVSFWGIVVQIVVLDVVFSFDSVLTAVGMVSFKDFGHVGAMTIMVTAVVLSVGIMLLFLNLLSNFVNEHPTIQMLALSFLMLIAVMLLVESAHLAHIVIFEREIVEIPKGYIYFAIGFSMLVEALNIRMSKKSKPVKLKVPKKYRKNLDE
ncbi:TerC family protein [Paludibacter sp. 221]|uniref:TerC family protein n=1 Tax=Paludibacter sp. 221 TaxID=2302939 RepID=UPI0019432345|nr:TerC family protein [Paludibacter sp. 221]